MSKQEVNIKSAHIGIEGSPTQILEKIKKCQKEISKFRDKCDKDIFEIEKLYIKTVKPLISNRNDLILGLPYFWSKTLLQHPLLKTVFEPGEEEVLRYLNSLDVEENMDNPDYFKIHFIFGLNPYFENKILTKQFNENGSESSTVKWKGNYKFPKTSKHEIWEYDDLGLEYKGFFRWFADNEEQFCDPIADILRSHIWNDPLEFYFDGFVDDFQVETRGLSNK